VYYNVALGFYRGVSCDEVLRCLSEGIEWVMGQGTRMRLAGKWAISQGKRRSGCSVMEELFEKERLQPAQTAFTLDFMKGKLNTISLLTLVGTLGDSECDSDSQRSECGRTRPREGGRGFRLLPGAK
jgi:hypothetical protein